MGRFFLSLIWFGKANWVCSVCFCFVLLANASVLLLCKGLKDGLILSRGDDEGAKMFFGWLAKHLFAVLCMHVHVIVRTAEHHFSGNRIDCFHLFNALKHSNFEFQCLLPAI